MEVFGHERVEWSPCLSKVLASLRLLDVIARSPRGPPTRGAGTEAKHLQDMALGLV